MTYYIELFIHGLTNLFIIVILFWFFFWDCERHNAIRRYFTPKVYRPFAWIGLNVEWTMFTPDPPHERHVANGCLYPRRRFKIELGTNPL